MEKRNPTQHRMTRRAAAHDYRLPGIYHITLHVAEGLGQPLGAVMGSLAAPDGSADAPHTALSPVGQMVEHELLHAIPAFYPMIEIQDYVIMPEHLHFIIEVHDAITTRNGKPAHLGQIIAGFKKGCNRRYWEMIGQGETEYQRGKPAGTNAIPPAAPLGSAAPAPAPASGPAAAPSAMVGASAVSPQGLPPAPFKVPSRCSSGRAPLFAAGYCDVMPLRGGQLATQRAYIKGNPRSRLLRSGSPSLRVQRGGIATALTPSALLGYLRRECGAALTPEAWEEIRAGLLLAPDGTITCDTFGDRRLLAAPASAPSSGPASAPSSAPASAPSSGPASALSSGPASALSSGPASALSSGPAAAALGSATSSAGVGAPAVSPQGLPAGSAATALPRPLLPVVCHRKDAGRFGEQKRRCHDAAARGAVLVSARIAKGEQGIIDEAMRDSYPVVLITDNGFGDRYHPSADRLNLCAAGRLLLVTPWTFQYKGNNDAIHVPRCKTMNCVAQALCRTRDSWWQQTHA